jgi:hypothetical protein
MRGVIRTLACGGVAALIATSAVADDQRYEAWQPDGGGAAEMVKALRALVEEAEHSRAADPRFLDDLKALANKYATAAPAATPVQLMRDDFRDGDYTRGVRWTVVSGKFWIEDAVGLRTLVTQTAAQPAATEQQPRQREGDLASAIIGNLLSKTLGGGDSQPARDEPQQQPATPTEPAEIRTALSIPNAFAMRMEMTSRVGEGEFHVAAYQGREALYGYRVIYAPGARTGLKLVRFSPRRDRVIGSYNRQLNLEDNRLHVLEIKRGADGRMVVSMDGAKLIEATDTAFRDPFDGIAATNVRGDYAIRDIAISRLR